MSKGKWKNPNRTVIDLCGVRFGRLLVKSRNGSDKQNCALWLCDCDCGNTIITRGSFLKHGTTQSCGCLQKHVARAWKLKHGYVNSKTYRTWDGMIQRCSNATNNPYHAGKGVKVCERWKKFEHFLADMGERPDGTSLDRIDVDGDYEPSNCRWATQLQQSNNTQSNRAMILLHRRLHFGTSNGRR